MRKYTLYILLAVFVVASAFTSCDNGQSYDHYRSVDVRGWDQEDTLEFNTGKLQKGVYQLNVGFRATSSYPYKDIAFTLSGIAYPSGKKFYKKIKCGVFDNEGRMKGNSGISSNDYMYRVDNLNIDNCDSVRFIVVHNMNLAIIPGITDVGVQLIRK